MCLVGVLYIPFAIQFGIGSDLSLVLRKSSIKLGVGGQQEQVVIMALGIPLHSWPSGFDAYQFSFFENRFMIWSPTQKSFFCWSITWQIADLDPLKFFIPDCWTRVPLWLRCKEPLVLDSFRLTLPLAFPLKVTKFSTHEIKMLLIEQEDSKLSKLSRHTSPLRTKFESTTCISSKITKTFSISPSFHEQVRSIRFWSAFETVGLYEIKSRVIMLANFFITRWTFSNCATNVVPVCILNFFWIRKILGSRLTCRNTNHFA